MTTSKREQHAGRNGPDPRTMWGLWTISFDRYLQDRGLSGEWRWPNAYYRDKPCEFFEEVLGVPVWGDHTHGMQAMLELIRDWDRVAVRAGRKVSKSLTLAGIALWYWSSFVDAQVIISSVTARQVDDTNWSEVRKLHHRSQFDIDPLEWPNDKLLSYRPAIKTKPLDGEPKILARSGLSVNFRKIAGYTAREGVAAQGKSGVHQLYLIDEASGVPQAIIDAIIGNMAGGGKLVLFGNPTSSEGEFHDAFGPKEWKEEKRIGYHTLTISSEESPNVREARSCIPGMATEQYILERELEWGRDNPLFIVHVQGKHVEFEEGRIVSLQLIFEAEERWRARGEHFIKPEGVLHIGVDPAFSATGDEAVCGVRRGKRVLSIEGDRKLRDEEGHLAKVLDLIKTYGDPGEIAVVNLDSLGDVGAKVQFCLRNYVEKNPGKFIVCSVRASDNAVREPAAYWHVYDELWGVMADWLRAGGAIPEHPRLAKDLHAPSWKFDKHERKLATRKDDLRKILGRSPDWGNALCLTCWENSRIVVEAYEEEAKKRQATRRAAILDEPATQGMDPYAALDQWQER